ncbi:M20 family metallopeptidase [Pseudonocardia sp. CA-107938]|uniref:M20 family metallopeptidase n=1 Tax=Pseudonocardia sp. CA-107938 TaxID=3240021 RepID=UPI003D8A4CD1
MDLATTVQAWIEPWAEEMAELLAELVAMDTENPPGRGLGRCGTRLRSVMEELGLEPEIIPVPPHEQLEEPCVVRGHVGNGSKLLYFHGHFDVVPAQSRAQFLPERRNGRMYGRGTADMKGGLVSMLYGAAAARDLGLLDDGKIVFHLVCDEETGSDASSGYLRREGLIDPAAVAMVTAEPTAGAIWHASRGALTLRVEIKGREAHVGQAHLGDNAFAHMVAIAAPLNDLARELLHKRTAFPMADEVAKGSMMVVGGASGSGANFNAVPGSAWFSIDRRFNPEEDVDEEIARLTEVIDAAAAAAGASTSIEVLQRQPSGGTPEQHPLAQALAASAAEVEGSAPTFELCPGILETRWYSQLGVPAFGYGPGRLDVSHGPGEYIDEAAMRRCAAVYALFAARAFTS